MTLDEAIKHAEEVAEEKEKLANTYESFKDYGNPKSSITLGHEKCLKCAEEHRQLAEWLKELKQLRGQTRWIPVSERLPKKGEQVLCCNNKSSVFTSALTYVSDGGYAYFGQHFEVIAWQPLPKPYKESEGKE